MKLGVVGLPNVGKSTLFNAITQAGAQSANYPFCTIEPNVGVVDVPDERLNVLSKMYDPQKITPASIEFVDIAGLVQGASRGEGLGNKFLSHIREVDAVVHVVRCFEDDNIAHVDGRVDPIRDVETIETELMLADLETVQKRLVRSEKLIKSGDKKYAIECVALTKIADAIDKGIPARSVELDSAEKETLSDLYLLSAKSVIYAANISEDDIGKPLYEIPLAKALTERAKSEGAGIIPICAKIEEELIGLLDEDKREFLNELGLNESALEKLIVASYDLLGLISYLTAGPKEVRAWTIKKNTKAPQAAGKIHTDFEKGFIRAEVIAYDDLIAKGSMTAAKDAGLVRSEGKEYIIADGDVVLFRFNV